MTFTLFAFKVEDIRFVLKLLFEISPEMKELFYCYWKKVKKNARKYEITSDKMRHTFPIRIRLMIQIFFLLFILFLCKLWCLLNPQEIYKPITCEKCVVRIELEAK